MSIITLCNNEIKETGQSLASVAMTINMALDHNYKILLVSTAFLDKTLENCFWNESKSIIKGLGGKALPPEVGNGVEGLSRVFASSRGDKSVIRDYTKVVFKDRLDVLAAPKATDYSEYTNITGYYAQMLLAAREVYDLIFVDLSNKMDKKSRDGIIEISDIIMLGLRQNLSSINQFIELKEKEEFYRKSNVMLLFGKYDENSKYTAKNVARSLKEKEIPCVIPYNTLFLDASSEGNVVDVILKQRDIRIEDENTVFIKEIKDTNAKLIYKMQEQKLNI